MATESLRDVSEVSPWEPGEIDSFSVLVLGTVYCKLGRWASSGLFQRRH